MPSHKKEKMNSVLIVLPILAILMFDLGLTLKPNDFLMVIKRPKAIILGLLGQLIILPAIAFGISSTFHLEAIFFIGFILISCCPGGSSSNIFSMLAKGDTALSVSLTALSSVITLFTIPIIMNITTSSFGEAVGIKLPVGKLIVQNIITMLVPVIIGLLVRYFREETALKIEKVISKFAFPALLLLITIFYIQNSQAIIDNIGLLGVCTAILILAAISIAAICSKIFGLNVKEKRTIVIEVGMQNGAQAMAIAASPFIFNNSAIAIPAIIYTLLMNIILLSYLGIIKLKSRK